MNSFKVTSLATVGFLLPIVIVILLVVAGWNQPQPSTPPSKASLVNTLPKPETAHAQAIRTGRAGSFAAVESAKELDPALGKSFFVSFLFRFERLPPKGKREHIVSKIDKRMPLPGWVLGVSRTETSLRPEVYWRGTDRSGGWFDFDAYRFRPGVWYAVTLVARVGDYLLLFIQALEAPFGQVVAGAPSKKIASSVTSLPVFLGGVDVRRVRWPRSRAALRIGAVKGRQAAFEGEVTDLLIGSRPKIPDDIEQLKEFIAGGPAAIVGKLKSEEIALWLERSGKDGSRFQHEVTFSGTAAWQVIK